MRKKTGRSPYRSEEKGATIILTMRTRLFKPFRSFRTFRRQLIWNFLLTIGLMGALSAGMVITMLLFFMRTDRMLHNPTSLARINHHLTEVHQYVTNFVNYDDQKFVGLFFNGLETVEEQYRAYTPVARAVGREQRDLEFYYSFLEIGNMMNWYREHGEFLITEALAGTEERFLRFDRLYQLRDLKNRISGDLSDLVFRQMMYSQESYGEYRDRLQYQWVWVFLVFGATVIVLIQWAIYQATTISSPIQHLIREGHKIAHNDFQVQEAPNVRNEELQALNSTFSAMAAGIARSIEILSQKNELERKNLEMSQSIKQAELELLQSQINPHFLFNTLNTICSLAQIEDAEETGRLLGSLSTFLRYNLKNMHSVIAVHREIEMIEHYLFIQKQRFGTRLEYTLELEESARYFRIPSLTIQPLVENALIHGIEPVKSGGHVSVTVEEGAKGVVVIRIADTGSGIPDEIVQRVLSASAEQELSREHMGLANTLRRIRLYDPRALITIEADPGRGTVITMEVHTVKDAQGSEIDRADRVPVVTG
jgi:sensor histidine kinase YesM